MTSNKSVWDTWDLAWDSGHSAERRLELLQQCATPDFVYTNPAIEISEDLPALVKYIEQALQEQGNALQVKHVQFLENNNRSALQWNLNNKTTNEVALSGWSYGQYDGKGKLTCVADFW